MSSDASWQNARVWRMRAVQNRALANEMNDSEPKATMLKIADEYNRLAEWAEKNSISWWDKKRSVPDKATDGANIAKLPELSLHKK